MSTATGTPTIDATKQVAKGAVRAKLPRNLTRWMRVIVAVGRHLQYGSLRLVMPDRVAEIEVLVVEYPAAPAPVTPP